MPNGPVYEGFGDCAWCPRPAIDLIYTEGSPAKKKRKTAPVCREHWKKFHGMGMPSHNVWFNKRDPGA